MDRPFASLVFAATLAAIPLACVGKDHATRLDTRPGASISLWVMPRANAVASVVLLPGGEGGFGLRDGVPQSNNFLVRSRELFAAAGFNVIIVGKPNDQTDLTTAYRTSSAHVEDLRKVVEHARSEFAKPVWLVGTSRGTTSAAAAAMEMDPQLLAGVVFTSSMTDARSPGALQAMSLSSIRVPALVMSHRRDECRASEPREGERILGRLSGAPVKKLVLVDAGGGASGDPCGPMHWHGYIGMEEEAVRTIAEWIKHPAP